MADKKISELDAITGANTAATDVFVVVDTSTGQTKKITREELNNAIEQDVLSSIDIDTINGDFTVNGNINLGDDDKAIFGAGSDLQIYHDGSNSYVQDAGTGDLILKGAGSVFLKSAADEVLLQAIGNGAVKLNYDNATKLFTTATGIDVNGTVTADNIDLSATGALESVGTIFIDIDKDNTSTTAALKITADGQAKNVAWFYENNDISFYEDTGTTAKLTWDASGEDLRFADNSKAVFGAGSDLQIYHDGSNSYVQDAGTGNLYIQSDGTSIRLRASDGTQMLRAEPADGSVRLYYGGSQKFITTSTGIDVTGTVTADGLTVDGSQVVNFTSNTSGTTRNLQITNTNVAVNNRAGLYFQPSNGIATSYIDGLAEGDASTTAARDGAIVFGTRLDGTFYDRAKISSNGDISFYEDTGTTAKLFWDASAERLGLGTTSPRDLLNLSSSTGSSIVLENSTTSLAQNAELGAIEFYTNDASNAGVGVAASIRSKVSGSTGGQAVLIFSTADSVTNDVERMRIDPSGRVGIGTSSPSSVLHIANATPEIFLEDTDTGAGSGKIIANNGNIGIVSDANNEFASSLIYFTIDGSERARLTSDGRLGIGTTSPSYQTHIKGTGSAFRLGLESDGLITGQAFITDNSGSPVYASISSGLGNLTFAADSGNSYASSYMDFQIDGSEKARLTSDGRLGIGTSSPAKQLHVYQPSGQTGILLSRSNNITGVNLQLSVDSTKTRLLSYGDGITFWTAATGSGTNASERMRIDSSGRVLTGKTASNFATTGVELHGDGTGIFTKSSSTPLTINRTTDDGGLVAFYKDGSLVGSIGVTSNRMYAGTGDTGLFFNDQLDSIDPWNTSTNAARDNAIDLGDSTRRFKDLYLGGGVYVGGTTSSNHLDDYEEGTWTPTGGGNVAALSGANGHYTKVGNLVTVTFEANADPTSTSSNMAFGGLPFTVVDHLSSTNVGATGIAYEDNSFFVVWANETTNTFLIELDRPLQGSASSTSKNYRGTLTYFTS